MLDALNRLFARRPAPAGDSRLMEDWASHRGDSCKRSRKGHGCVVAFSLDRHFGRMEWGPPQRAYIPTRELRVRIDMGFPQLLEMMVIARPLARRLESEAFTQMVRGHQTGIDSTLPEEQRWLSVFEPVEIDANPAVQQGFVILSSSPSHARRWVEGELANRLVRASARWLGPDVPLVLMTLRGRLYLRTEVPTLDVAVLDGVRGLAEVAASRAVLCQKRPATDRDAEKTMSPAMPAPVSKQRQVQTTSQAASALASVMEADSGSDDDLPTDLLDSLTMPDDFDPVEYSLGETDTDLRL